LEKSKSKSVRMVLAAGKRRRRLAVALLALESSSALELPSSASATKLLRKRKKTSLTTTTTTRGGYVESSSSSSRIYGLDDSGWNSEAYVDGYEYEAPQSAPGRRRTDDLSDFLQQLPMPDRKTGLMACAAGAALTMLGVSLFFEKNLIRLGNLLLVFGAFFVAGPQRAVGYLADTTKLRGTLVFAAGFFLILSGHPLLGTLVEVFGFFNLFGNLFPLLGSVVSRLPVVNSLANLASDVVGDQQQRIPDPFDVPWASAAAAGGGGYRDHY